MNIKLSRILRQFYRFILISGTGWVIDFAIFYILAKMFGDYVGISNMLSAIPSITFVFLVSTKKIFNNKNNNLSLIKKYIIYFVYQIVLITCVSIVAQLLYNAIMNFNIIEEKIIMENLKIFVKLCITPITMTINFIVMKILSERL